MASSNNSLLQGIDINDSHKSLLTTTIHNNGEQENITSVTTSVTCILRSDVIQIRQSIRLEVESRSRMIRILDGIKNRFGFRTHCKVLLNVLNRAVDLIDESSSTKKKSKSKALRRQSSMLSSSSFNSSSALMVDSSFMENNNNSTNNNLEQGDNTITSEVIIEDDEWFYYKDFAFYSLKVESKYPWMRNAGVFSILLTFAFYFFTPIFWCSILNDENICPRYGGYNEVTGEEIEVPKYHGWLSALFFASATMSTVGYGDVTVLINTYTSNEDNDIDTPYPGSWRIFIATLFMILSLVVSVVGFQAGLDSHFHPFRQRIDIFGRRVFEVLRDANIVKGKHDKHEEIISRMRLSKLSQLAEIILSFLILNLVGVFAVQLSLLVEKPDEYGEKLSISWMESFYWAVQTTTTIGYGVSIIRHVSCTFLEFWHFLIHLLIIIISGCNYTRKFKMVLIAILGN